MGGGGKPPLFSILLYHPFGRLMHINPTIWLNRIVPRATDIVQEGSKENILNHESGYGEVCWLTTRPPPSCEEANPIEGQKPKTGRRPPSWNCFGLVRHVKKKNSETPDRFLVTLRQLYHRGHQSPQPPPPGWFQAWSLLHNQGVFSFMCPELWVVNVAACDVADRGPGSFTWVLCPAVK